MDDEEFLRYVESHVETERAGFVGEHMLRLAQLAKHEAGIKYFTGYEGIYDYEHGVVRQLLNLAKANRSTKAIPHASVHSTRVQRS